MHHHRHRRTPAYLTGDISKATDTYQATLHVKHPLMTDSLASPQFRFGEPLAGIADDDGEGGSLLADYDVDIAGPSVLGNVVERLAEGGQHLELDVGSPEHHVLIDGELDVPILSALPHAHQTDDRLPENEISTVVAQPRHHPS